jgi:hypothetical protein
MGTGTNSFTRNCPDDHQTCFKGPSTCDGGGTWANVCSCDTSGDLPAGATTANLFDATEVFQYQAQLTEPGVCGSVPVTIEEKLFEHDPPPLGVRDLMGTLTTTLFPTEGAAVRYLPVQQTITRTGGPMGSYSGTFGATLKVETNCAQLLQ